MKIAQVSPLYESVPPKFYGGTERIISFLTEALIKQGHEVTLFASGDSITHAHLVSPCTVSTRLSDHYRDSGIYHTILLDQVFQMQDQFDIIHFHTDYLHFLISRHMSCPSVTTLHGRLDIPDLIPLYRQFRDIPLVSISESQQRPLFMANWVKNVYHGLPLNLYSLETQKEDYLAFLGRISPEKGPDLAVEIARRTGKKLKMAAKIDPMDKEYHAKIKHLLKSPHVEFLGEIPESRKNEFLGKAQALLFPITWPEPFGLVMIEAMACGTPVIAFDRGSVPEILEDGKTGFLVSGLEEAVAAVRKLPALRPMACREVFKKRFSVDRMARDYLTVYNQLIAAKNTRSSTLNESTKSS